MFNRLAKEGYNVYERLPNLYWVPYYSAGFGKTHLAQIRKMAYTRDKLFQVLLQAEDALITCYTQHLIF